MEEYEAAVVPYCVVLGILLQSLRSQFKSVVRVLFGLNLHSYNSIMVAYKT